MWRSKLRTDCDAALKLGDVRMVGVLRYLISVLDKRELQLPSGEMNESEEIKVLRKEMKNKEEARVMFLKVKRTDLVTDQDFEIEVLKKYLPAEVPILEVETLVEQVISEKGKNPPAGGQVFGVVMGEVMKRLGGKVSGETVSKIVKDKLA
ncbi:hypothetical protein COY20_03585 [Candidatus Shapirobacteria bacterium CG_4_10_14_0_2_um_filter_40_12]|uniref:Glutamyl-tRNA amidotransferase n=1 Tax=Candidatus Shapirobacteria bacterium CG_4_10_14_0_2_um_filter_40_12 TaxID=1974871 RepID=A0A2M7TS57_9BACT|nr:MAG: hypothetical protein COY20_03585 [Candidatus Shapirobacteria bacterium CG_4_10_14_0_2_um_filter_40_12]